MKSIGTSMTDGDPILVIQTAYAGDLILTLPLVQGLRILFPGSPIDVLCIPETAPLIERHPAVDSIVVYDKRGKGDRLATVAGALRHRRYSAVISPHRSLRSAILAFASRARTRISFDKSSGSFLYSKTVPYQTALHEVDRNLSLLAPFQPGAALDRAPRLYPSDRDDRDAQALREALDAGTGYIAMAPGSVWATKRYTLKGFIQVAEAFVGAFGIVLVGGPNDAELCDAIARVLPRGRVVNTAGKAPFLVSAALIRDARVLISNDSAPVHVASAVGTPVVEIFGATSPSFGFTPVGVPNRIVQVEGLPCQPCRIHGGRRCPIGSFDCMNTLAPDTIISAARELLEAHGSEADA